MGIIEHPETLAKFSLYNGRLEEAVSRLTNPLKIVEFGLGNTVKYAGHNSSSEEPYLLMVSQEKNRRVSPWGYNTILTITSLSDPTNRQVSDRFESETGIRFNIEIPANMKEIYSLMGKVFPLFLKDPQKFMDELTKKWST